MPGIQSYVAKGEPTKSGRGPTISKTSPILGSRQEDCRPNPLLLHMSRDQCQPRTDVQPLQEIMESVKAVMEMQRETQLQLMSTINSIQPKEPQENLSEMGDAQLWEELDKEDRDSERWRMITKLLRDRAIAKATGNTAKTAVPVPKSASTPNNLFTRVGPIFDVGGKTETPLAEERCLNS